MTKKAHTMKRGIALLVGCLVGIPAVSQAAQERKSPLADSPAIRKRLELRDKRFELGVGVMQTLNQDFYNALMLSVRLGFHFTDWLGFSVSAGVLNLTPSWRTSFNGQLNGALASSCRDPANQDSKKCQTAGSESNIQGDKTPSQANAAAAENRIGQVILPQFDIVPFTGKFSMFSKLFMNYDFYLSPGFAIVNLVKKGTVDNTYCADAGCRVDTGHPYTGLRYGFSGGLGMHAFVNNFFAINLELHNLIYKNNASGRNITSQPDQKADNQTWTYNWMLGLNFMFFLPAQVRISH